MLKDKIAWLEATNEELNRELNEYRRRGSSTEQYETEVKVYINFTTLMKSSLWKEDPD